MLNSSFFKSAVSRIEGKLAIKTGLAGSLALITGLAFSHLFNRPDSLISGLWTVMAAIVVLQANLGGTYKAVWVRFLGILIGSLMGGALTSMLGSNEISLGISITLTVILCSAFNLKESVRIACMSVAVVIVLWGLKPTINPWTFSFFRIIDSCLGLIVALVVTHLIWPFEATQKLRFNIAQILSSIKEIFCLVTQENLHKENVEEVTRRLTREVEDLFQQNRIFLDESSMELLMHAASTEQWTLLNRDLQNLFEEVLSLKNVYRDNPRKIFDAPLADQLAEFIAIAGRDFDQLLNQLHLPKIETLGIKSSIAMQELNSELIRFRSTHTTRKYNLQDVERFFVFFYNLNAVVEDLKEIEKEINNLNME